HFDFTGTITVGEMVNALESTSN
ncbi:MMPL family protein, partial [Vibrio parahaemolyticus EKP-021]